MEGTGLPGCRVDGARIFSSTSAGPHPDSARAEGRDCRRVIHAVDAEAGRVDQHPGNASTGPPQRGERHPFLRIPPAQSKSFFALAFLLPMELHVETDELARRIADELRPHEERFLSDLVARVARELGKTPDTSALIGHSEDPEVMGIKVHGLYPVSFVADRWDVSEDNVRKKPQVELPRSGWKGGEIRYRGIDILRYEGVDVEEHLDEPSSLPEDGEVGRVTEPPQSHDRGSTPSEEDGDGHPYSDDLPALSNEDSSPD